MKPLENDLPTDSQLTDAIRNNDQLAFKDLFYKYYPKLFRFAVVHIQSKDLACDLVQEVFFRVWNKREKLNPKKSIQAYLYKILNNLIINHYKLASTKTVSLEHEIKGSTFSTELALDAQIDIKLALDKLPTKLKSVFILSKVDGFKYEEVAEICGISIKAVEKRMTTVLRILKKFLA
jgi:RNA polymerase sigma-70 factor, ECF subfamily